MTFVDRLARGYWKKQGFFNEAVIEPCEVLGISIGRRRRIKGGGVTEFYDRGAKQETSGSSGWASAYSKA